MYCFKLSPPSGSNPGSVPDYIVLATPRLIPRQKWFVLSLTSLCFYYSHLDKG